MSLFKGKRGVELSLWTIVQLILILVFVFFPLWEFVLSDHYKLFERRFVSKDIALMIDTLYAAPGDVYYTYDQDTEGLGFNFSKNYANVFYEFVDVLNYPASSYNFFEDIAINFIYSQFKLKDAYPEVKGKELQKYRITPTFIKKSSTIESSLGGLIPSSQESVIAVPSRQKIAKVLISYSPKTETRDILENIAIRVETGLKSRLFLLESNPADFVKRIQDAKEDSVKAENPNLLIVLEVANDPSQQSKFSIIRSSTKQSQYKGMDLRLSQLIQDNIISNTDIKPDLSSEDNIPLLNSANISVKIVLGNIADQSEKDRPSYNEVKTAFEKDTKKMLDADETKINIARSIYNAVEEYNK